MLEDRYRTGGSHGLLYCMKLCSTGSCLTINCFIFLLMCTDATICMYFDSLDTQHLGVCHNNRTVAAVMPWVDPRHSSEQHITHFKPLQVPYPSYGGRAKFCFVEVLVLSTPRFMPSLMQHKVMCGVRF